MSVQSDQDARPQGLSVSIVTFQVGAATFIPTLTSLVRAVTTLQAGGSGKASLTVVDNSDQAAELRQWLAAHWPSALGQAQVLSGHGNIGYGRGHNLALTGVDSRYHLVLNPDVVLDPQALVTGLAYLDANPGVVAVAPAANGADGAPQYLCKRYPSVLDLLLRGFAGQGLKRRFQQRLDHYELRDQLRDEVVADIPIISGCFMLCRTEALRQAGGFDESYFLYFEDFALSLALRRQGRLAWLPAMKITHGGGNSAGKGLRHILMFTRSGIRFFNQHGWKWG